jgi:hypothetical protein
MIRLVNDALISRRRKVLGLVVAEMVRHGMDVEFG